MIFEYLDKLRHQPPAVRQRLAITWALIGTGVIILLWLGHWWLVDLTEEALARGESTGLLDQPLARIRLGVQFIAGEIQNLINNWR